jgi:hypothetical protein
MVEIATSHKTLLAMTDLDRYFHSHLVLQSSMTVYPENTETFFKGILLEQLTRISLCPRLSPSFSPFPIKGEGTLSRHCETWFFEVVAIS